MSAVSLFSGAILTAKKEQGTSVSKAARIPGNSQIMPQGRLMSFIRKMALMVPQIRTLYDQRNQLLEQNEFLLRQQGDEHLQANLGALDVAVSNSAKKYKFAVIEYPINPEKREWSQTAGIQQISALLRAGDASYTALLEQFAQYADNFQSIKIGSPAHANTAAPYWNNTWFEGLDAASLYSFVAMHNPRIYFEVGSGNSTKFVKRAIEDHNLRTRIVSVDPMPRAEVDDICDEVIRTPLEETGADIFSRLTNEDILFIDSSHQSFQNSDVTVFFTELMAGLPSGMLYGIHDILLPLDYSDDWKLRFYNEMYLLAAYLIGGAGGDVIVFPVHYMLTDHGMRPHVDTFFDRHVPQETLRHGGAFWMRKA